MPTFDQAVRSDLDALLRHDQGAVEERELTHLARSLWPDGERAAGIAGDVTSELKRPVHLALEHFEDHPRLEINAFFPKDVFRNGAARKPVVLNPAVGGDVGHGWIV